MNRTTTMTDKKIREIHKDFMSGLTWPDIANKYNTSSSAMFYRFRRLGLPTSRGLRPVSTFATTGRIKPQALKVVDFKGVEWLKEVLESIEEVNFTIKVKKNTPK